MIWAMSSAQPRAASRTSGNYHGGGSPIMEQIAITTQYDIESRKKLVKYIAGMSGGDREALNPQAKTKK